MRALGRFAWLALLIWLAGWSGLLRAQAAPSRAVQGSDERLRAAETALERNDLKLAASLLGKLAEERPQDAHVLFDLGYADEGLDDTAGAAKAYRAAIAADPGYGEAHVALGLLLARTRPGTTRQRCSCAPERIA